MPILHRAEQLALDLPPINGPVQPTGRDRLQSADAIFFAIHPPAEIGDGISQLTGELRDRHGLVGRPLNPACLHLSLVFTGFDECVPPEALAAIKDAASTIAMQSFRIRLDRAVSFRHQEKRPLVLCGDDGVTGVIWLRDALLWALARVRVPCFQTRFPRPGSQFTPHLTLLYDEGAIAGELVEPMDWLVRDFVLVRSLHGHGQHEVLARWKLRR